MSSFNGFSAILAIFIGFHANIIRFFNGSIFQTFFISPIEVVKVQQQIVAQDKPMSVKRTIGYIYENAGLRGFARGYGMCFFREPIAFTVYFSSFEWMTRFVFIRFSIYYVPLQKYFEHFRNQKDNNVVTFVAGGIR